MFLTFDYWFIIASILGPFTSKQQNVIPYLQQITDAFLFYMWIPGSSVTLALSIYVNVFPTNL